MKTITKKQAIIIATIIISTIVITTLAFGGYKIHQAIQVKNAKIQMQQDEITKKDKEIEEKTLTDDQKRLVEFEKKKKENIDSLNILKDEISERIKKKETIEKLQACYDEQVDRIMTGKDTDEEYCEERVREEEENERQANISRLKKNCYDRKADLELEGEDLKNFCENPYRLTDFEEPAPLSVYRHEWNDDRNKWLDYMYKKSGYDKDMIMTFLSENDNMGLNRPSNFTGFDGKRAYGICQLYDTYHGKFIRSEEFQDPYKQMDYCIGVWNDAKKRGILGQTFHAYSFRYNAKKKLVFVK